MSRSSKELQQEKARLLGQIQQQRLDLAAHRNAWLDKTAPFDHGISVLLGWRKYLVLASGLFALYGARHPVKALRWSRYVASTWGAIRLVRRTFRT